MKTLPVCPKCGYAATSDRDPLVIGGDGAGECPACGIVSAKYRQRPGNSFQSPGHQITHQKRTWMRIGLLMLAAALTLLIYWFIPPLALLDQGDSAFGAVAESAGGSFSNVIASSKGKYIRVSDMGSRRRWTAKAARQPSAFALSTTGRYLVTADMPRRINIWEKGTFRYAPICDLESDIDDIAALMVTTDERRVVAIGDSDQKVEIMDIGQRRLLKREYLQGENLESFLLLVTVDEPGRTFDISLSMASLVYAGDGMGGDGIWRLQDQISGRFVQACNDGYKARFEPAKSLSWNPSGRYSAYAEKNQVLIWKLCANSTCKFTRNQ